jgi:steroid delta-isomerase-like uncharacterized protein
MSWEVAKRFYELLNAREFDRLNEVMASDCRSGVYGLAPGLDAYSALLATYTAAFPDLEHEVLERVCEGDRVAVVTRSSGTHVGTFLGHPATGRSFSALGMDFLRFRDGLIVERRGVFDTVAMLQQLGIYR